VAGKAIWFLLHVSFQLAGMVVFIVAFAWWVGRG
jgi:hypothetical protein